MPSEPVQRKVRRPSLGASLKDESPGEAKAEGTMVQAALLYLAALMPAMFAALVLNLLPSLMGETGGDVVEKALAKAFRGGIPGAVSAVVQIILLMWLRTVTNYQYKHGGTMDGTIKKLYAEGGVMRFYQGWHVAAAQVPISRFVDAAANEGMLELFKGVSWLPVLVQTLMASGEWRGGGGYFRAAERATSKRR